MYRDISLKNALAEAKHDFDEQDSAANIIRLNRLIIETAYADFIKMSIQSLHPYIVSQIAMLYPAETVDRIDKIYDELTAKLKTLPYELIARPLDTTYENLTQVYKENIDISSIFTTVRETFDAMDKDMNDGLDRAVYAYYELLDTLNEQFV